VRVKEVHHLIGGHVGPWWRHHPGQREKDHPECGVERRNNPKHKPDITFACSRDSTGIGHVGAR